jgi:hypothetical protein
MHDGLSIPLRIEGVRATTKERISGSFRSSEAQTRRGSWQEPPRPTPRRRKIMTKQIRNLIGVTLLLAAVSASAQSANVVRVKIPFPFVTAGKNWPAADYRVQIRTDNGALTLSSPGIGSATLLTNLDERPGDRRTYLQFERGGDRWFLQEVTLDGMSHVLPTGELTKEPAKERVTVEAQSSLEP